jgi:hypothetical protein
MSLPASLKIYFWDVNFETLRWEQYRNFITRRILQRGDWEAIGWLRAQLTDAGLRAWLEEHEGGGLESRQIRFWELMLDMDKRKTNRWVKKARSQIWERRVQR